jgi:hypothetical protein
MIILLNNTTLHYEEKFKFAFLLLDEESTAFLSIEELEHIIKLNFLLDNETEINKRLKLIKDEVKKRNSFDNEVYEFDLLFSIVKQKANFFYPV